MKVYVAGPYSGGYIPYNVKNAVDAAEQLAQAGHYAYIPHLSLLEFQSIIVFGNF